MAAAEGAFQANANLPGAANNGDDANEIRAPYPPAISAASSASPRVSRDSMGTRMAALRGHKGTGATLSAVSAFSHNRPSYRQSTFSSAQKSWKKTGVKINMMNALKRSNMEVRALYGEEPSDLPAVAGVEIPLLGEQHGLAAHGLATAGGNYTAAWARGTADISNTQRNAQHRCVMHPECRFRQIWDAMQVFLLMYVAITVPFRFCFNIQLEVLSGEWLFELFSDIYFISDIVINFRTGYLSDEHQLIMEPKHIKLRYLKGWFLIDCVACLPIGYITQAMGSDGVRH